MTVPTPFPDFWGFLHQQTARLDEEATKVTSDAEMKALLTRWLDPKGGVLEKIKNDPLFSMAKPSARKIFMKIMRKRVHEVEGEWKICRAMFES